MRNVRLRRGESPNRRVAVAIAAAGFLLVSGAWWASSQAQVAQGGGGGAGGAAAPPVGVYTGMNNQSGFLTSSWDVENTFGRVIGHLEMDVPYQCANCVCNIDEKGAVVTGGVVLRNCGVSGKPPCFPVACPPSPQCPAGGTGEKCLFKVECCIEVFDARFLCDSWAVRFKICP